MQGSPGTGKTFVTACIALQYALLGAKILCTAPANLAVDAFLSNVSKAWKVLQETFPAARLPFNIVYLTTNANTKADLIDMTEEWREAEAHKIVAEEESATHDPLKDFRLFSHSVRSIKIRADL